VIRQTVIAGLRQIAFSLGPTAVGTEWHLFGSVERDEQDAEDIDLMIFCNSDEQADSLRGAIDPDSLVLPLHVCFLTFGEAAEIDAVRAQRSRIIYP
jgi:predicted nucleotidyltransferase